MSITYTGSKYDSLSPVQIRAVVTESLFPKDASASWVTAKFYFVSVDQPEGMFGGGVSDNSSTVFNVAIWLGDQYQMVQVNSSDVARTIGKFGDTYYIGELSTSAARDAKGNGKIRVTASTRLAWVSGIPLRTLDVIHPLIDLKYNITFNANGGSSAPKSTTITYGHNITLPSQKPTRSGFTFKGWALSKTGAVKYQPSDTYGRMSDTTLYAIWSVSKISIHLNDDNELEGVRLYCSSDTIGTGTDAWKSYKTKLNQQILIPYKYSCSATPTSVTATPYYVDSIENYVPVVKDIKSNLITYSGDKNTLIAKEGVITISSRALVRSLENCKTKSGAYIGIHFEFNMNGDIVESNQLINCAMADFNFLNVQELYSFIKGDMVYYGFKLTFPKSFSSDITANSYYPQLKIGSDNLTPVSRESLNKTKGTMIALYSSKYYGKKGFQTISYMDLTHDFNKTVKVREPSKEYFYSSAETYTAPAGILIANGTRDVNKKKTKPGQIYAYEFIENDAVVGFFNGGSVCGKTFIEGYDAPEIRDNGEMWFKEIIEETKIVPADTLTDLIGNLS